MARGYLQHTTLSNVGGRIDYISNTSRQENLVAFLDSASANYNQYYWSDLAKYCDKKSYLANGKNKSRQASEHIIELANDLSQYDPDELAKAISDLYREETGTENCVALHWNKAHTNFHAHVIFSENKEKRETIEYGAVFTRDTYFDAKGKRSTKKKCLTSKGELKKGCALYKKGQRKETATSFDYFDNKDARLKSFSFTYEMKNKMNNLQNEILNEKRFISIEPKEKKYKLQNLLLSQQKVGNVRFQNPDITNKILNKNKLITQFNRDITNTYKTITNEKLEIDDDFGAEVYNELLNVKQEISSHKYDPRNEDLLTENKKSYFYALQDALKKPIIKLGEILNGIKRTYENVSKPREQIQRAIRGLSKPREEVQLAFGGIQSTSEYLYNSMERLQKTREELARDNRTRGNEFVEPMVEPIVEPEKHVEPKKSNDELTREFIKKLRGMSDDEYQKERDMLVFKFIDLGDNLKGATPEITDIQRNMASTRSRNEVLKGYEKYFEKRDAAKEKELAARRKKARGFSR